MIKKTVLSLLALLLFSASASGAPVGNIADPAVMTTGVITHEKPYGFVVDFEYDVIDQRIFEHQPNSKYETMFIGARIGAILRKSILIYGIVGRGTYKDDKVMEDYDSSDRVDSLQVETDPGFVYGGGITAMAYEKKIDEGVFLRVGIDAKYRRSELDTDDAELYFRRFYPEIPTLREDKFIPNTEYSIVFNEYQAAVEVSYQIDNFIPYIGFKVSEGRGQEEVKPPGYESYADDIKQRSNKGYFLGISYHYSNKLRLGIETRSRDESAVTINALVRF